MDAVCLSIHLSVCPSHYPFLHHPQLGWGLPAAGDAPHLSPVWGQGWRCPLVVAALALLSPPRSLGTLWEC